MAPFLISLFNVLIVITSIFLICLVLIQRGKGGGLAGAFGGAGGSSAFGTKAGDVFTRITMITAGVWIVMLMIQVILTNQNTSAWVDDTATTPAVPGPAAPGLPGKGGGYRDRPPAAHRRAQPGDGQAGRRPARDRLGPLGAGARLAPADADAEVLTS